VLFAFSIFGLHFTLITGFGLVLVHRIFSKIPRAIDDLPQELKIGIWRLKLAQKGLTQLLIASSILTMYCVISLAVIGSIPYAWLLTLYFNGYGITFPLFLAFMTTYTNEGVGVVPNNAPNNNTHNPDRYVSSYTPWSSSKMMPTQVLDEPPSIPEQVYVRHSQFKSSGAAQSNSIVDDSQERHGRLDIQ
jgi:hypothetical protein